jgi:putative heme-binding domain-containing protein
LANSNQPEAYAELLKTLTVAPASLQSAIAVGLARTSGGAEKLMDAVANGKASARLLQEWPVHVRLTKYGNLKDRLAKLTHGLQPADKRLQELLQQRRAGFAGAKADLALGAKVFEKHCANCHQIGGKGAKIGPQLDGIGIRGIERLLEDLIDPNRNVDQAFRATTLALKNGQIVSGLVLREEGEVVVMADAQGKEVRFTKSMIEERTVSQLSPMPANLIDQIPEADFYHLLGYLLSQRPTAQNQKTR